METNSPKGAEKQAKAFVPHRPSKDLLLQGKTGGLVLVGGLLRFLGALALGNSVFALWLFDGYVCAASVASGIVMLGLGIVCGGMVTIIKELHELNAKQ